MATDRDKPMTYYYATIDVDPTGRCGHFHRSPPGANQRANEYNARAETMGIKARATVAAFDGSPPRNDIRD